MPWRLRKGCNSSPKAVVEQRRASVVCKVWRLSTGEITPCTGQGQTFVLFRPSTDWMRLMHIIEGSLLYSMFPNLMQISSQNTFTETSRIMFVQIIGHHGPAKLMHKINHPRDPQRFFHTQEILLDLCCSVWWPHWLSISGQIRRQNQIKGPIRKQNFCVNSRAT